MSELCLPEDIVKEEDFFQFCSAFKMLGLLVFVFFFHKVQKRTYFTVKNKYENVLLKGRSRKNN